MHTEGRAQNLTHGKSRPLSNILSSQKNIPWEVLVRYPRVQVQFLACRGGRVSPGYRTGCPPGPHALREGRAWAAPHRQASHHTAGQEHVGAFTASPQILRRHFCYFTLKILAFLPCDHNVGLDACYFTPVPIPPRHVEAEELLSQAVVNALTRDRPHVRMAEASACPRPRLPLQWLSTQQNWEEKKLSGTNAMCCDPHKTSPPTE